MLHILKGKDHSENSTMLNELFQLRYQIFVSQRRWSLPSIGCFEIDEYDNEHAIYFIDTDERGVIQGSVRITPTNTNSLTADYFSHLIENGEMARAKNIYEATRYIISPSKKCRKKNIAIKVNLLTALTQFCIDEDIHELQTIIDSGTLNSYLELNPWIKPLGLSHPYGGGKRTEGGGECMVIRWPNNEDVINHLNEIGLKNSCENLNSFKLESKPFEHHIH